MKGLQVFHNPEFGEIRTVEVKGEPWLVGRDVAQALGYTNPQKAVRDHVDVEDRGVNEMVTPSGTQEMTIINESGLYSLVLSSKLPGAKKFKRWVTAEVLPSIRRHGQYARPMTQAQLIAAQAQVLVEMEGRMEAVEARTEAALDVAKAPDPWKRAMLERIRGLCRERGLTQAATLGRLYQRLELETGCMLGVRVSRLQERKRKAGMTRREALGLGKMDAISCNSRLRKAFEGIVEAY